MIKDPIRSDYYSVLNADELTQPKVLETNARNLLKRFAEAGKTGGEEGAQRTAQRYNDVVEAYAVLIHPKLRNAYNIGGFAAVDAMADTLATAKEAIIPHILPKIASATRLIPMKHQSRPPRPTPPFRRVLHH